MEATVVVLILVALLLLFILYKTAVVVPQQSAFVVERLGRYHATLNAGFHILVPFVDVIRYRHSLKEQAIDIPAQVCITRDNVQVGVDGILYLKVLEPRARVLRHLRTTLSPSPSWPRPRCAARSARSISTARSRSAPASTLEVVGELDKASEAWGVKVLRYEIKNIEPPADILAAMEKQMRAEREKRARDSDSPKASATPPSTRPRARSSR